MFIKRPALRVPSANDIDKDFHAEFAKDCFQWLELTPFADLATGLFEVGSYARQCAQLRSDIDISVQFKSQEDLELARRRITENEDKWREARAFWISLIRKYGIHIEWELHDFDVTQTPKSYLDLSTLKYHKGDLRRLDKKNDQWQERLKPQVRPPFMEVTVTDDEHPAGIRPFDVRNDTEASYDPWVDILSDWRKKNGSKHQEFGSTPETDWMNRVRMENLAWQ